MDIRHVPDLVNLNYPDETGQCRHLENGRCRIYEDRPMACRIDELKPPTLSVEMWHTINTRACDFLHLKVYRTRRERGEPCKHRRIA